MLINAISLENRPNLAPDAGRNRPDAQNALAARAADTERFTLTDIALCLRAPDGIARSKLAAQVEKCLGRPTTARNLRSLQAITTLARN
ncbi:MAG: hypothetical protein CR993_07610 [Rhodobacterales bacterium]|nr:MAG: hypothetical protein CR993_07610 [Rhodobacterales bacterium]